MCWPAAVPRQNRLRHSKGSRANQNGCNLDATLPFVSKILCDDGQLFSETAQLTSSLRLHLYSK